MYAGNWNFSIRGPIPTKEIWDGVQDEHSKTQSLCIVMDHSAKKSAIPTMFLDLLKEIMECWTPSTPLRLKIAAWHSDRKLRRSCLLHWTI